MRTTNRRDQDWLPGGLREAVWFLAWTSLSFVLVFVIGATLGALSTSFMSGWRCAVRTIDLLFGGG